MPRRFKLSALLGAAVLATSASPLAAETEHVTRIGAVEVMHAWTRATDGPDAEVFMELHNEAAQPDRLIGAASDAAGKIELHGAVMRDGAMTSVALHEVVLTPLGRLKLEPNVVFLKLSDLERPLSEGGEVEIEVVLERAGRGIVHVEVGAADATQHSHAGHTH